MYESYDVFVKEIYTILPHLRSDVKTTALNVIANALFLTYGDYDVNKLVIRCGLENEARIFSQNICTVLDQSNINEMIWTVIKEILRVLPVSIFFIDKINRFTQDVYDIVIPSRSKKKPDFDKFFYIDLIDRFKQAASIQSVYSLKTAFGFVYKFLETYDFRRGQFFLPFTKQNIVTFCNNNSVKLNKLRIFLNEVLNQNVPDYWFDYLATKTDFSLITTQDIEILYLHVRDKPYEELIFLLLLTTGITLHGLLNIKIKNVALIQNFKIYVKNQGFLERKRSKTFPICPRIAKLLEAYLLDVRPAVSSEYLFLTKYKSLVALIKKIINDCGLSQKKFKPLVFGRTYTRSLTLCGNSSDDVLECLQLLIKSSLI
ncbi:hypothetical protein KM759_gp019 [Lymphocystis disease virus 4]|uniref:Tyr recombinase domain-containing protein n=1 Tax=Lymphocystis disease virus 4 TaxID=2704413 RepID=A0A6B9XM27_9VIRU|nr:hypothetical protein KM759_gp019 [Lymphocystis disease virus 4]QHR78467.1 hypothetical protein [Lymphocystis disease virus 4]